MKRKFITGIFIVIVILFGYYLKSNATINTQSSMEVESGKQFDVQVTSDVELVSYTIQVNAHIGLEFVTSKGGSDGEGTKNISYATGSTGTKNMATFTFKAPEVSSDTKYTITFSAKGMGDNNLNSVEDSNSTTTITVKAPDKVVEQPQETPTVTKSSNANLKMLGIKPLAYDFKNFAESRTSYTVTVPYDVTSVSAYFEKSDSKSTVKITGGSGLNVGNIANSEATVSNLAVGVNNISIAVTAEDGTTKTYKIAVTRQEEAEEVEEEPEEETEEINNQGTGEGLKLLEIEGITITPEFSSEIYEYKATLSEDVTTVEITAEATSEEYKIEIIGNENLVEGENLINIMVYNEDGTVVSVYQINLNKNTLNTEEVNEIFSNAKKTAIIRIVVIVLIIILVIIGILIYFIIRLKENKEDDESYKDEYKPNEYSNFKDEQFKIDESPNYEDIKTSEQTKIDEEIETNEEQKNKKKGKHF